MVDTVTPPRALAQLSLDVNLLARVAELEAAKYSQAAYNRKR